MSKMVLALALVTVAWSQATDDTHEPAQLGGQIHGRVLDSAGLSLSGAIVGAVRIEPVARPIVLNARASDTGDFTLRDLPRGRYLVVASLVGFTQVSTEVDLSDRRTGVLALVMKVAAICDCLGGSLIVKNPEGQGIPGPRLQKEGPNGTLTDWGLLDSRGQIESGMAGGDLLVIDAPGYGRHRIRLPAASREPFSVTLNVSAALISAAAQSFAPSIPDLPLQLREVVVGVATTTGDFMIAVDSDRIAPAEANVREYIASGLREGGPFRVLTGLDVVREIQRRLNGQKVTPPVTIIAIKRAR